MHFESNTSTSSYVYIDGSPSMKSVVVIHFLFEEVYLTHRIGAIPFVLV